MSTLVPLSEIRGRLRLEPDYPTDTDLTLVLSEAISTIETLAGLALARKENIVETFNKFPYSWKPQYLVFNGLTASVSGVTYVDDETGNTETITDHETAITKNFRQDAFIFPPESGWPKGARQGSIQVTGTHGVTPDNLPIDLKGAILLLCGKIWEGVYDPDPDPALMSRIRPYQRIV